MRSGSPPHPAATGQCWYSPATPVADRIGAVVVAALSRTRRGLSSELPLTAASDGVPSDCVANFDTIHTLPREAFRRPVAALDPARLEEACQTLKAATSC